MKSVIAGIEGRDKDGARRHWTIEWMPKKVVYSPASNPKAIETTVLWLNSPPVRVHRSLGPVARVSSITAYVGEQPVSSEQVGLDEPLTQGTWRIISQSVQSPVEQACAHVAALRQAASLLDGEEQRQAQRRADLAVAARDAVLRRAVHERIFGEPDDDDVSDLAKQVDMSIAEVRSILAGEDTLMVVTADWHFVEYDKIFEQWLPVDVEDTPGVLVWEEDLFHLGEAWGVGPDEVVRRIGGWAVWCRLSEETRPDWGPIDDSRLEVTTHPADYARHLETTIDVYDMFNEINEINQAGFL